MYQPPTSDNPVPKVFRMLTDQNIGLRRTGSTKPRYFGRPRWFVLISALSICLTSTYGISAIAEVNSQGPGWPALMQRVDSIINAAMSKHDIPGMTIAVSVDNRLVMNRGIGSARKSKKGIAMRPDLRTRIGSVSKVVVTAPAAIKMLKEKHIPKTKKLYGRGGVFESKYKNDIKLGVKRFWPIAAMAIDKENRVYTWYSNGKYSIGTSSDLDFHQALRPYSLPPGRRFTDILDIAISKNNRVHVWYNDGAHSVGRSDDLDARRPIDLNDEGKVRKVKLPGKQRMLNVVGIGIAKSNNHIYAWYDDGTLSSGTALDFTHHNVNESYSVKGGNRYQTRAIGIAANDKVFAWLSNGIKLSGKRRELGKWSSSEQYSIPAINPGGRLNSPREWYSEITLQHLFDHEAGFQNSGDKLGASKMFNVSKEMTTYDQAHRYFLRTRPLRWKPGTYSYSNHGFGIWTLIFEELAGVTYRSYAINRFLKRLGVYGPVRPMTTSNDKHDSCGHNKINGVITPIEFENSTTGLAAGGWTASAASLLDITNYLTTKYSLEELDDMGWARSGGNVLSHNGLINGGTAYVFMFPDGYKSVATDGDLSNVHIAIAANIKTRTNALKDLAVDIVREIPNSNIDPNYDISDGKSKRDHQTFNCG